MINDNYQNLYKQINLILKEKVRLYSIFTIPYAYNKEDKWIIEYKLTDNRAKTAYDNVGELLEYLQKQIKELNENDNKTYERQFLGIFPPIDYRHETNVQGNKCSRTKSPKHI